MYIYTFAIVAVHIYTITVTLYTIILLISLIFFSLLRVQNNPHLLFPQIHTNTSTQTNQHRDTQTLPYKQTNREREREISVGIGRLWIGGSVLVVEIRVCGLTEMGLDARGSVLTAEIGARGST